MDIESEYKRLMQAREYYNAFLFMRQATASYLESSDATLEAGRDLILKNIELLEVLGASKQFEMDFDMQKELVRNRNQVFRRLLKNQDDLIPLFNLIVGNK